MMQAQSSRPVNTFTIGFGEKNFDEAAHARSVARHLRTDHTELRISPADALDLVPDLPRWFDEPMSSRSEIPAMLVSALARRQVTVALSGDGGDELFGGYGSITGSAPWRERSAHASGAAPSRGRCRRRRAFRDGGAPRRPASRVAAQIVAQQRWRKSQPPCVQTGDFNSLYRETRNAALAPSAFLAERRERPLRWEAEPHAGIVSDGMERMGYFDFLTSLADGILTKVDRASMAHGLEVRVPLLDHRVVEYAWSLPPRYKYGRKSENKRLLRRLLYRYVPPRARRPPEEGIRKPGRQLVARPAQSLGGRSARRTSDE